MLLIDATGLEKAYSDGANRVQVLRGLDLSVDASHSLAITGPSGSGKSTVLNILAGVVASDAGEISITPGSQSFDLHLMREKQRTQFRRQNVGYVFQFFNLIPTLTVAENVLLPLHLNRRMDLRDDALELLVLFGLGDRADSFPAHLSGGEQQRVAVARALALRPPLVLADEPTGNLDGKNSDIVADLLFRHASERGATLVVATHSESVANLADQRVTLGND
jgi:putative ABC transport system ATP-binding protein